MTAESDAAPTPLHPGARRTTAVSRVADQIRDMFRSGEIVPGQQLRQESLAGRLGVSRAPVREALKALETEGMLRHEPHVGYTVTRLNAEELRQMYLMRRVLETEVLLALPRLTGDQLRALVEINDEIVPVADAADITGLTEANYRFHFTMFRASGLDLVVDEIARIWAMTEPYRTVHLYHRSSRGRVAREHRKMISALRRGDNETLVELMDAHRQTTLNDLDVALRPNRLEPRH